jgi:CDP-glucose 4,6-dehydratase
MRGEESSDMATSFANFYRDKRVLVTGHTGFRGGWLTDWLKLLGAQVTGFSLPPNSRPNFFDATALDRGMTSLFGDIRDRGALAGVFADRQPEILIHTAAQTSIAKSYREPAETYATNVMGTIYVLEEARYVRSLRAIVVAQQDSFHTAEGFAEPARTTLRFPDQAGADSPADPYRSSQQCLQLVINAYRATFFGELRSAALASIHCGDVIGGGDWAEHRFLPHVIAGLLNDRSVPLAYPDLPYLSQHVLDATSACLLLAQRLYQEGGVHAGRWHAGPREPQSAPVGKVVERLIELWGGATPGTPLAPGSTAKPGPPKRASDERHLAFEGGLDLEQALRWTVEWYRSYYQEPASAWRITQEQLQRYLASARPPSS